MKFNINTVALITGSTVMAISIYEISGKVDSTLTCALVSSYLSVVFALSFMK